MIKPSIKEVSAIHRNVSFLGILMSVLTAIFYWAFRYGFADNSFFDLLKAVSLSSVLLLLPDLLFFFKGSKSHWYKSGVWFHTVVLFSLSLLGAVSLYLSIHLEIIILILGLLLVFLFFFQKQEIKIISFKRFALFLLFGTFTPFFIYKTLIQDPLFLEKIVLGTAHIDHIYLSGISNMIRTYNIPTIGIDGIIYLPYHWGSHYIFAYLAELINIPTDKFYSLVYPVVFFPFLLKSFFYLFIEIRKIKQISLQLDNRVFIVLFIAIIGFVPNIELNKSPLMTNIIVLSESYLMGLSFSIIIISLGLSFFSSTINSQKKYLFWLLVIPLYIGLISILKISSGFLVGGLFGYLFFRLKWYKKKEIIISAFVSAIIFFIAYQFTIAYNNPGGKDKFELFSFYKKHVPFKVYFTLFYYYLTILFIAFIIFIKKQKINFSKNNYLELELLIFISLFGLIPGLLLDTTGRNSLYFMDLQRWLSLILIMAYFPLFINKVQLFLKQIRSYILILPLAVFLIMAVINVPRNFYLHVKQVFIHNIYIRNQLIEKSGISAEPIKLSNLYTNFNYKMKLPQIAERKIPEYKLLHSLAQLNKLTKKEKKESCLYIPKSNKIYWHMLEYKSNGTPFIAPYLTGICMIEGVPEIVPSGFGYSTVRKNKNASRIFTNNEILEIARTKGFKQVYIYYSIDEGVKKFKIREKIHL